MLFGDSHDMQLVPALEHVALRRRWREYALRRIERDERPALVLAAGSAHHRVLKGGRQLGGDPGVRALAEGWRPVLRRLRAAARHVIAVTDPPRAPLDVPACVSAHLRELRRCAFARGRATARAQAVSEVLRTVDGIRVLDPTDVLCLEDLCPGVIGDVLVYRKSGHLTASFAATMGPWLGRRLPRLAR